MVQLVTDWSISQALLRLAGASQVGRLSEEISGRLAAEELAAEQLAEDEALRIGVRCLVTGTLDSMSP